MVPAELCRMTSLAQRRRHARVALAAVICAGAVLYCFPPDRYGFYPRCPIYEATGWLCPGCGATRALAALLHGHVAQAMHWNPMIVLLLPAFAAYGAGVYWRAVKGEADLWPRVGNGGIAALLAAAVAFTLVRNLT